MAIDFGKQIGPLPLGAWVAVVGVGLGIAYYTRNSGGAPVEVEDGSSPSGVGDGSVGGWIPTSPGSTGDPIGTPDLSTNESWGTAAINYLIAQGYNPTASDQAIRKYLAGEKLGVQETALVGYALMRFGSPPNPLPPVEDGGTDPAPGNTVVPAPQNLRLISVGTNQVSLRWDAVPGAVSYVAYISPASRTNQAPKAVIGTRTTWYGLTPGTTYYFSVQALSLTGKSAKSTVITVRTKG